MVDSELLVKALNSAIPIVQQGGLSGAMYRAEDGHRRSRQLFVLKERT